jgi:putative ABC transport system permease protein
MLKNYFKIALRNIRRHKGYTLLNVAGLAIGMAACLLIAFFVRNERSYDTYHQHAVCLYRVAIDIQGKTSNRVFAKTSAPFAAALQKDFPQVENAARLLKQNNLLVTYGPEKKLLRTHFLPGRSANFYSIYHAAN